MNKSHSGFTLAEVLIALVIIGVVAAITIPLLISNYQDQQFKTAYKKAFTVANNAYRMGIGNGGTFSELTAAQDGVTACANWQLFSNQFNKAKECTNSNNSECWAAGEMSASVTPYSDANAFIDNSGMAWTMRGPCVVGMANVNEFMVDTNGNKPPNTYGKDRWGFNWFKDLGTTGIPDGVFVPSTDYTGTTSAVYCPTGPCYYKTWLVN